MPAAPNEGAMNFAAAYGLRGFSIIDERGNEVFKGSITEHVGPLTEEDNAPERWKVARTSSRTIPIAGAAATNPQVNSAPASTLRMCRIVMALLLSSSQSEAATTGPVGLRACERRSQRDVDGVTVLRDRPALQIANAEEFR
jgi:hypothetical protein